MQQTRRSVRLRNYDYSQNGTYFITVCTADRAERFGCISDQVVRLNLSGEIVDRCWKQIPAHFPQVELDEFVVMPNHLHAIIVITGDAGGLGQAEARLGMSTQSETFGKPAIGSLATIVRSFKAAVSKHIREASQQPSERIWQRNYYEHVIRNDGALNSIRQYIQANPAQWEFDVENPMRGK